MGTAEESGVTIDAIDSFGDVCCSWTCGLPAMLDVWFGDLTVANGARSIAAIAELGEPIVDATCEMSACLLSCGVDVGMLANSECLAISVVWSGGYSA